MEDEDLIGLEMNALFVNIIEKYGGRKAYKLMTEEELIIELDDLSDENERLKKENEKLKNGLDEIYKLFEENGVETGYNKRILEVALQNLKNGDY